MIRDRFHHPIGTPRELVGRITFDILCSNIDDHARNHAAFWDGRLLTLTPACDVCPQARAGAEVRQAMAIGPDGWRFSQLAGVVEPTGEYLPGRMAETDASEIIDHQTATIRDGWNDACDRATLTRRQRDNFWERQVLNPYAFS